MLWYKRRGLCYKCGLAFRSNHSTKCPAQGQSCFSCWLPHHFARCCLTQRNPAIVTVNCVLQDQRQFGPRTKPDSEYTRPAESPSSSVVEFPFMNISDNELSKILNLCSVIHVENHALREKLKRKKSKCKNKQVKSVFVHTVHGDDNEKITQLESEKFALNDRIGDLNDQLEHMEKEILKVHAWAHESLEELKECNERLQTENQNLVGQINSVSVVQVESQLANLKCENEKLAKEADIANYRIGEREKEIERLKQLLDESKQAYLVDSQRSKELEQRLKTEAKSLNVQLDKERETVKILERSNDFANKIICDHTKHIRRHVQTIRQLTPQVNSMQFTRGGKHGRPNLSRHPKCNVEPCKNKVQHCRECGRFIEQGYCFNCKSKTKDCTFCTYMSDMEDSDQD